jgi:hypothetical protein
MSLATDLLDQAEHLAGWDPRRPKQASLRRAISTADYAVFHLLVADAASRLATGPKLRHLIARAYSHAAMKKVCQVFNRGQLPDHLTAVAVGPVPPDLQRVAATFVALQEARHLADYSTGHLGRGRTRFTRTDVARHLGDAREAFEAWGRVRAHPIAQIFLVALLLDDRWGRG